MPNEAAAPPARSAAKAAPAVALALLLLLTLGALSLTVGASESPWAAWRQGRAGDAWLLLWTSRGPRTAALWLTGAALGVSGLLMQLLTRNRFVEPGTVGTSDAASLGLLCASVWLPDWPVAAKMTCATAFALLGTMLFFALLQRVPSRGVLMVPLVGLVLGRVLDALTTFIAYRLDRLQALSTWSSGDFSQILAGRYELLWIAGGLTGAAYLAAYRFTAAGMGEAFATNLGVPYRRLLLLGLALIAAITATTMVTVGNLPLFGLVVPNLVSLRFGDHAQRAIPWVAWFGAAALTGCDVLGRVVRAPYEIPVSTVIGVIGAAVCLVWLARREARHA